MKKEFPGKKYFLVCNPEFRRFFRVIVRTTC
jgi:hypothetical protein